MVRGCLILILMYAVAAYLEYQSLKSLPFAGFLAAGLGLGITLVLGSLQGLGQALRLRAKPETEIAQWRDGQQVRVSGVLYPTGEAIRAPISDRSALFCDYMSKAQHADFGDTSRQVPRWNGLMSAPCVLRTRSVALAVLGVPSLHEIPEDPFQGHDYYPRAASHLAHTEWQIAPELISMATTGSIQMVSEGLTGLPPHLINRAALERLRMRIGQSSEAELIESLAHDQWRFSERIVPPGAEVTLVGTYKANPPSIDINYSASTPEHALYLGGADRTAARHLASTFAFIIALAAFTAAAHYAVYAHDGLWYREALQGLGLLD